MRLDYFEIAKSQLEYQLFIWDLERARHKARQGQCICEEPERWLLQCPVHHISFPPKGDSQ